MSDEKIVTQEDILDFVGEVFVNNICPWCKCNHWALEKTSKKHLSFMVICVKCGYVRTHNKEAVATWKEEKYITKRTIWVNAYDDRGNNFETDVLIDDIKSMQSYRIFATVSPIRCVIEMKNGEEIHAIESLEEIKQKIEAREKFYAR